MQFTGKERDTETGLDFFGPRYLSSAQGRFTSPDEPFIWADPENPQSWNLYAYGLNNPLVYSDPTGHEPCENGINPENGNICTVVVLPKPKEQPIITKADLNPLDDGPPLAFQGFVNLVLNGQVKRGSAQLALGILPSALLSFGAARLGAQPLFQGFQAAEDAALAAKGLSATTVFNEGKGVVNGETTGMTNHALSQALVRGVTKEEIGEALTHVAKSTGGSVLSFSGEGAEVRVNQVTGKIVTVIRFSSPTAK